MIVDPDTGEIIEPPLWRRILRRLAQGSALLVFLALCFAVGYWSADALQLWLYDHGHNVTTWPHCAEPGNGNPFSVHVCG